MATRVAELERALRRARGVGEALRRVAVAVGSGDARDSLLELVVDTATEVLMADRATLYLLEGGRLISRVKQGEDIREIVVEVGKGIAGHVARTGRPLRVKDAHKDARFDASWDNASGYRTRSVLTCPMKNHHGETIGVIQVLNKRADGETRGLFTPYDTELLKVLATQAAVSIEKSALFDDLRDNNAKLERTTQELERSLADLALIYELESSMSRADSIVELVRCVVAVTAKACDAAAGALLHRSFDDELTLYVVNLTKPEQVREVRVRPGEGIAARAMDQRTLLRIDDPKKVSDPARVRKFLGLKVHSAIAMPLASGAPENTLVGAIALYNQRGRSAKFSDHDAALLKLVSANVSTELRVLDARLQRERAERFGSLGQLLSGVMHDLRTPLTVISGYVQLMQLADDPSVRAEYGRTISEQFEIIGTMQNNLLAYASGETSLLIRKAYVGRFCQALAHQFKPEVSEARITLEVDVRYKGVGYFDETKIARAIGNLMRNAIEAMGDRGGTMKLGCDIEEDTLVFWVSDTGPGVPPSIQKTLFLPFVTKGKKTGTGLGLSNVKKLAEEHGGEVVLKSSSRLTTFFLRLPMALTPHALPPASTRGRHLDGGKGGRKR